MDKTKEIREHIEHIKEMNPNGFIELEDVEYLLTELDAAKQNISQITEGRFELLNENISLQQQLDTVKQENERLQNDIEVSVGVIKQMDSNRNLQHENFKLLLHETGSLRQQLKQAIKALEDIEDYQHRWSDSPIKEVQKIAHEALSQINSKGDGCNEANEAANDAPKESDRAART